MGGAADTPPTSTREYRHPDRAVLRDAAGHGRSYRRIERPRPNVARLRSLVTHSVYGLGLLRSAWLWLSSCADVRGVVTTRLRHSGRIVTRSRWHSAVQAEQALRDRWLDEMTVETSSRATPPILLLPPAGERDHQDVRAGYLLGANLSARLVTVSQWHPNVEHCDLWPERLRLAHSGLPIKDRAYLTPESFEERRHHFRRIDVIVGHEHPTADARRAA